MSTELERALQREKIVETMRKIDCRLSPVQISDDLTHQGINMPPWKVRRRLLELRRDGRVFRHAYGSTHQYELALGERRVR
jgi:Fe2+ or Zn2+ uptake regulation protein